MVADSTTREIKTSIRALFIDTLLEQVTDDNKVLLFIFSGKLATTFFLGSTPTVRRLRNIRQRYSPDILFLMETKNQDDAVFKLFANSQYSHHFTVPPMGLSGGLLLSWQDHVELEILDASPNYIDVRVSTGTDPTFITFVYGVPRQEERANLWEILSTLGTSRDEAWLITGDFNDLLDNSEKSGGPLRWEGSFVAFRSFVVQSGLWDLQHTGNQLSWRGTRYNHFIQSKLDRAMANCRWSEIFPASYSEYLSFEGSDHRPLITYLDNKQRKKRNLFRYDRRLTTKPEIKDLVKENWNQQQSESVLTRLCRVRQAIISWSKKQNSNSKDLIMSTQQALEIALSNPVPDTDLIGMLMTELDKAYSEEESYWRQRSRIMWLQHGDKNSSFFHAITRGRKAANKFSIIEKADGTLVFEEKQIAATFADHYSSLFTSTATVSPETVNEVLTPRISEETNSLISCIPNNSEIKKAVFAIHGDKAPGPDGFSANFYQGFWDIVGDEICRDIKEFFATGALQRRYNETHVRLIPKIKNPKTVNDYRPIALCSTHYKIIAKILCSRLKPVLPSIISQHQSAFVAGRAISDNVLITHEILHYLRTSSAKVHCSMAVKTDMSKAYDRLEWSFLENVMAQLGFHSVFIGWIMECVSSVSYSFLINGSAQGSVLPSRGIRQGDPLSPYLFIMCSEVLSGLCSVAQDQGKLQGLKVARNAPALNHLLFADDTMFFCKSDEGSCRELVTILDRYESVSGQSINLQKSAITFSAKTPIAVRRRVKAALEIEAEGGIGKYLGLPEHFNRKKKDIFAGIIDRIRQKSHSWTTRFLNSAGKQVLLKSILAAMPTYAMSCFKIPVSLCKQIQSILTRFWWDAKPDVRKISWVSWSKLTMPRSAGGLGFREIEQFNDALLAKLAWRVLKSPDSLLAQTLAGKYCHSLPFLQTEAPKSASHGWRGVIAGRNVLLKGLGWIVGSGTKINVWTEPWLSTELPLTPIGPPTFTNRALCVSDLMDSITKEWNVDAIQQHLPQYEEQILSLIPSAFMTEDELVWLPGKTGSYSTKSGYALCKVNRGEEDLNFNWNRCVWQVKTTPKLRNFLWKVKNQALPVGANLIRRGIEVDGTCKRCGMFETERHVLLQCPFARRVWELAPTLHKPRPDDINSPASLLQACLRQINLPPAGLSDTALYPWIFWSLWNCRNKLMFDNRTISEQEAITWAIKEARSWQAAQLHSRTSCPPPSAVKPLVEISSPGARCFVDAAWNAGSRGGGFGCIFKDSRNNITHQNSSNRSYVGSAFIAEAIAVRTALQFAVSLGLRTLSVWSDSKALVSAILQKDKIVAAHGILFDIDYLCNSFSAISFFHVPRLLNGEADALAKRALLELHNSG